MKIAFYTPAWPPGATPNGIVTCLENLIPEYLNLGHEVFLIAGSLKNKPPDESEFVVVKVDLGFRLVEKISAKVADFISPGYRTHKYGALAIANAMHRLLEQFEIDILEMEESFGWNGLVAGLVDIPVVVRLHGPFFLNGTIGIENDLTPEIKNRIKREGEALRKTLYVTSPSQSVIDDTKSYYNIDWPVSQVIPNPVRTVPSKSRWSLANCDREEILFVGRFDDHKGGDLAVDAFVKYAKHHPKAHLTFVGPDPGICTTDGEKTGIIDYLEANIPDEIRSRITYLGQLARKEIEQLRRRAFLTLFCSRYENFPNTVLEALSFGCPLVATNVGGIPEIVNHRSNGLLAAPNATSIAECMGLLADDTNLVEHLSRQAVADVSNHFSPHSLALQSVEFFESVCKRHSR